MNLYKDIKRKVEQDGAEKTARLYSPLNTITYGEALDVISEHERHSSLDMKAHDLKRKFEREKENRRLREREQVDLAKLFE